MSFMATCVAAGRSSILQVHPLTSLWAVALNHCHSKATCKRRSRLVSLVVAHRQRRQLHGWVRTCHMLMRLGGPKACLTSPPRISHCWEMLPLTSSPKRIGFSAWHALIACDVNTGGILPFLYIAERGQYSGVYWQMTSALGQVFLDNFFSYFVHF